jgi:hypothetical protein
MTALQIGVAGLAGLVTVAFAIAMIEDAIHSRAERLRWEREREHELRLRRIIDELRAENDLMRQSLPDDSDLLLQYIERLWQRS